MNLNIRATLWPSKSIILLNLLIVLGTRPEAVKLAPVVLAARKQPGMQVTVCSTGQHADMCTGVLDLFGISADVDLAVMTPGQTLTDLTGTVLRAMRALLEEKRPDWLIVQGDTTTAFAAALAAFYQKIPVAHVEAGLRTGNIYAAAVGEKRSGGGSSSSGMAAALLNLGTNAPAAGTTPTAPGLTITTAPTVPQTAGPFPFPGGGASGGSDVYRIAPDGSPTRVWTSHEDIVYALAFDSEGHLLAGTGNRGHIFAITGPDEFSDLLKTPASQITAFAQGPGGGLYAATSNLGKVFVLGPQPQGEGTYESDVFDAKIFSRWGRAEFRGAGNVDLYARSGNVDNPDRNWSPWKKIDLTKSDVTKNGETGIPAARYAQWKTTLHAGTSVPSVDSVALNYLPKNAAPEIDEVTVQVGVKYQSLPKMSGQGLGSDSSASSGPHFEGLNPSSRDRDSIGVKWSSHDENDDQLIYSVYYHGDSETRWLLLKDNLTDKAYSFDASLLPDGGYTVKVVASDAPSHSPGEALTTSKESRRFEVDTTPPRIENLAASVDGGQIHVTFRAVDGFSPIKRAEYSVDAGEWKYVEPVGQLSDAKTESYDFKVAPETAKDGADASEHVVVVRVYDRYENMGAAKTLLHGK